MLERKSELTKTNSQRAISYNKQLKQARRKEIRQLGLLTKKMDTTPLKTANPYNKGRTNIRHVGFGAFQSFYGTNL